MLPSFERGQPQEKYIRSSAENCWGKLMVSMVVQHLCKQRIYILKSATPMAINKPLGSFLGSNRGQHLV